MSKWYNEFDSSSEDGLTMIQKQVNRSLSKKDAKDISTTKETLRSKKQTAFDSITSYKNYSRTQLVSTTFDYTWEIKRFKNFVNIINLTTSKSLTSAPFPETAQYKITMNTVPRTSEGQKIRFCLHTDTDAFGSCAVFVIRPTECLKVYDTEFLMSTGTLLCEIEEGSLCDYLYRGILTLTFKFEIFHKSQTSIVYTNVLSSAIPPKDLRSEDSTLHHDSKSGGIKSIKFIIGEEDYTVHKDLLCATNSTYFKALCKEEEGLLDIIVDITDELIADELQVFKDMLSFIKTGLKPFFNNIEYCMRLLKVALKYDVYNLKLLCERHLINSITLQNAVQIIQCAFSCDAKFLEKHAISFIKFHFKKINALTSFQTLPREHSDKIIELIKKCDDTVILSKVILKS